MTRSLRRHRLRNATFALLSSAAWLAACADDAPDFVDAAPDFVDAAPAGTVSVTGTVAGSDQMVLLGFLYPQGGSPQQHVARLCEPLSGDPATVAAVFHQPGATGNPCDLGGDAIVAAGAYQAFFGTYVPGEQTPQRCATVDLVIDGARAPVIDIPALGACP